MSNPYSPFCQDFYINLRLGSQLTLPHNRESVLHFFERVQKEFPGMTRFRKAENGEMNLEEDRSGNNYRWVSLEGKRLCCGFVNPPGIDEAIKLHAFLLELAPYHLGLSPVEIDYLDVLFGFDLAYSGNHDEVIAESLMPDSPLMCLAEEPGAKPVDVQPTMTVALSEDCRLQARIDVITRTNSYQVRTGDYADDVISVYFILRRYWGDRPRETMQQLFRQMVQRAEGLCTSHILPRVVRPISTAISSRS